jgi:D-beta-D-heptose 7-phosphate kinase/D-beta-D-heptose 1-phosphate adenosyltransferase
VSKSARTLNPFESGKLHRNHKIALVTGCFDVLHVGHLELIKYASQFGEVAVGLNDDFSIKQLKGPSRPINSLRDRMAMMAAMRAVYAVFPIYSLRVDAAIIQVRPKHWIKGGSYTLDTLDKGEVAAAAAVDARIHLFKMVEGHSTTSLLAKL